MKQQPVRLTMRGEDFLAIKMVLLNHAAMLRLGKKDTDLSKRIQRYLARAKTRPVIKADHIQQMRKDKNGEDELCYLGCLSVDGEFVPISDAKQRNARSTAIKDANNARRRLEANLDKEWA
jgi:hypothetical protein